MANPQLENGYLKIANELWEALTRIRIPGEARQCLDLIIRKTYGWDKKTDKISLNQFSLATGIRKSNINRILNSLLEMNIIIFKNEDGLVNSYRVNKDYSTWKPSSKMKMVQKVSSKMKMPIFKNEDTPSSKMKMYNKHFTKETNNINTAESVNNFFFQKILTRNPNHKPPNFKNWNNQIRIMIDSDKRDIAEIKSVIEWSQQDPFWQNTILSPDKLRKHYDQLILKMNSLKGADKKQEAIKPDMDYCEKNIVKAGNYLACKGWNQGCQYAHTPDCTLENPALRKKLNITIRESG